MQTLPQHKTKGFGPRLVCIFACGLGLILAHGKPKKCPFHSGLPGNLFGSSHESTTGPEQIFTPTNPNTPRKPNPGVSLLPPSNADGSLRDTALSCEQYETIFCPVWPSDLCRSRYAGEHPGAPHCVERLSDREYIINRLTGDLIHAAPLIRSLARLSFAQVCTLAQCNESTPIQPNIALTICQ